MSDPAGVISVDKMRKPRLLAINLTRGQLARIIIDHMRRFERASAGDRVYLPPVPAVSLHPLGFVAIVHMATLDEHADAELYYDGTPRDGCSECAANIMKDGVRPSILDPWACVWTQLSR